jgi:hypothetical protein
MKILEDFASSCDCDALNNQINKLQGDVMNYQQRAADTAQKCENDKTQIQNQNSSEKVKLTQDAGNAKMEAQEKTQKISDLQVENEKLQRTKVSLMDENQKLREDYRTIYTALTKTIDFAQTCQTNSDRQRVTLAESSSQLANSSSYMANMANRTSELINRYVSECYRYTSSYPNDRAQEKQKVIDSLTPSEGTYSVKESDILLASSDGKYKITKQMTSDQINVMVSDISNDKKIEQYEKKKLIDYLKSLTPSK